MPLFGSQPKGIPMPWKEFSKHQTQYIHQLSTPYPISGMLFGFKIGWQEPKLRDEVLSPKRGPKPQKRFSTCTCFMPHFYVVSKPHNIKNSKQHDSLFCDVGSKSDQNFAITLCKQVPESEFFFPLLTERSPELIQEFPLGHPQRHISSGEGNLRKPEYIPCRILLGLSVNTLFGGV
jgi:hypothetical protein